MTGSTSGRRCRSRVARATWTSSDCRTCGASWRLARRGNRSTSGTRRRGADQLFIIPGEDVAIGEGRVGPDHAAALGELAAGRLDELGAADLLVPLRRQARDDQLPPLVEHPGPVLVLHEVDGRPTGARH